MPNTEDLRYIRTEAAIRSAFMKLVVKTPVSSVTASDVCRKAGISRNAFYLHHAGVGELYTSLVSELAGDVRASCLSSAGRVIASESVDARFAFAVLGALAAHEDLLRALLPADDGTLAVRLADELEDAYVEAALLFGEHGSSPEHRLSCSFAAWAHLGIVRRWISQTDRPLMELLPHFEELQAGISSSSTAFLAGGEGPSA